VSRNTLLRIPYKTKPGDTVLLLGSGVVLQNWDVASTLELYTSPQDFA
jgi:hypothetical protein